MGDTREGRHTTGFVLLFLEADKPGTSFSLPERALDTLVQHMQPAPAITHVELMIPSSDESGDDLHFSTYLGATGATWANGYGDGPNFYLNPKGNGGSWRAVPVFARDAARRLRAECHKHVDTPLPRDGAAAQLPLFGAAASRLRELHRQPPWRAGALRRAQCADHAKLHARTQRAQRGPLVRAEHAVPRALAPGSHGGVRGAGARRGDGPVDHRHGGIGEGARDPAARAATTTCASCPRGARSPAPNWPANSASWPASTAAPSSCERARRSSRVRCFATPGSADRRGWCAWWPPQTRAAHPAARKTPHDLGPRFFQIV